MTSKLTREELLNIIETDHVQCGEASALSRMALAAMDSEPVQMFGIGSIFKPQRVIEQEADCDDCAHYNPKICHGEGCPAISQQSAQPAPVVPDAYVRDERGRMMLNGVCEPKIGFGIGWNSCRAAMLAAAQQEVKGE